MKRIIISALWVLNAKRISFMRTVKCGFRLNKRLRSFVADDCDLKNTVLKFCDDMSLGEDRWRFSASSPVSSLYNLCYVLMIWKMYDLKFDEFKYKKILDSAQSNDGLFDDEHLMLEQYYDKDWWGRKHLTLHVVSAYESLGCQYQKPISINHIYDMNLFIQKVRSLDFHSHEIIRGDFDNTIMNVCVAIKANRKFHKNCESEPYYDIILNEVKLMITRSGGLIDTITKTRSKHKRNRLIQFLYHSLDCMESLDVIDRFKIELLVKACLKNQNSYGGFSASPNSSACEDIDHIELLVMCYNRVKRNTQVEIVKSVERFITWNEFCLTDSLGGVFRFDEELTYGSKLMHCKRSEPNLFATWFRLLALYKLLPIKSALKKNLLSNVMELKSKNVIGLEKLETEIL